MGRRIPAIEAAHDRNFAGIGGPNAKIHSGLALHRHPMSSQLVVHAGVAALSEEIEILLGKGADIVAGKICKCLGHRIIAIKS